MHATSTYFFSWESSLRCFQFPSLHIIAIYCNYTIISYWLVVLTILKNSSQWEGLSHIWWKVKNLWDPQPAYHYQCLPRTSKFLGHGAHHLWDPPRKVKMAPVVVGWPPWSITNWVSCTGNFSGRLSLDSVEIEIVGAKRQLLGKHG